MDVGRQFKYEFSIEKRSHTKELAVQTSGSKAHYDQTNHREKAGCDAGEIIFSVGCPLIVKVSGEANGACEIVAWHGFPFAPR